MPKSIQSLSRRILFRITQALAQERDAWLRDDLRIAHRTVYHAAIGDAAPCSPFVLATYEILGCHPEKVWQKIIAMRRCKLGAEYRLWYDERGERIPDFLNGEIAPPKKPAQSVKLWRSENTNAARATNSRGGETGPLRTSIRPMATASIAALYPNSDAPSSAKQRGFTYEEMLAIVEFSGAPHSVRQGTLSALKARGRWPNEQGQATGIICISLLGMQFHGVCCRSTARWRARRAVKLGYWRELRKANAWSDCPKCKAKREMGTCDQCGYVGRSKTPEGKPNFDEFCRPYMYEVVIDKFRTAARPKEIRQFDARTYAEYKEALKRGDHSRNVTEMPSRKPVQPDPNPPTPPPATSTPVRQPAADYGQRDSSRHRTVVSTEITQRATKGAELLMEMCGLADMGAIPQIAISVMAEAKYRGITIEDAAKLIADSAMRDQQKGIALTRFYFRDLKWRSNGGGQTSAAQQRSENNKRSILNGFARNARDAGPPDGPEREDNSG